MEELMLLNCGAAEDSGESLGLQGDQNIVNPKGNQVWMFIGRTDADTEAPMLCDVKSLLIGKDSDAGQDWKPNKKWAAEDEVVR